MHVTVTADDIKHGRSGSGVSCPVARALSRAAGEQWVVGTNHTWPIKHSNTGWSFRGQALPEDVVKFIVAFDSHEPCEPFEFDL